MILKASQRGSAVQLGNHLLNANDNDLVEVHEVRGFASETVLGAMKETQAVAAGTKCRQHLFSVSLSPPETEAVGVDAFESAIERIEEAHGLTGHPRIVVFHEKEGRRHCHAVWSRIDAESMTAVPLSFFKLKLRQISKALYLEHGWEMPRGLMDHAERDLTNFNLAQWQQSKRDGLDPRVIKSIIQESWATSSSVEQFSAALEARGLRLARGDKERHVAVSHDGQVFAIARVVGKRKAEVHEKLGKVSELATVAAVKATIAAALVPKLRALISEADKLRTRAMSPLIEKRLAMRESHAVERQRLDQGISERQRREAQERAARLRSGVLGLWDRMTGERGRVQKLNEAEAFAGFKRDRVQRDRLIEEQQKERRALQASIRQVRHRHSALVLGLHRDVARQEELSREGVSSSFGQAAEGRGNGRRGASQSRREADRKPTLER